MNNNRFTYLVIGFLLAIALVMSGFALLSQAGLINLQPNVVMAQEDLGNGEVVTRTISLDNPNIVLIYEDELIRIYQDMEFGARIVVNKQSGVAVYCPCVNGVCNQDIKEFVEEVVPTLDFTPVPTDKPDKPGVSPTPTATGVPTEKPEPTPIPSSTPTTPPQPTPTTPPQPTPTEIIPTEKANCNNGLGNLEDCPPPGWDKDGDGVADCKLTGNGKLVCKGDNDDDTQTRPCGDPGHPCNNSGNNQENNQQNQEQQDQTDEQQDQQQDQNNDNQEAECHGNSCHDDHNNNDGNTPPGQEKDKGKDKDKGK